MDKGGNIIDEVTLVEMPDGKSYTGQKQAEIFCHGGQYILRRILKEILDYGVRPAEPGEFTRRAFLSGRIDLAKAEAVADLIASKTEFAYSAARKNLLGKLSERIDDLRNRAINLLAEIEASVDYPEEDLEIAEKNKMTEDLAYIIEEATGLIETYRSGKIIREGFKIVIAGQPNAGKSSLFNILLNQNRAIVAPIPGTTRDYLTEWIDLDGWMVSVTDTAGLRGKAGIIEKAGQKSTEKIIKDSDLIIWIVDITRPKWQVEAVRDLAKLPSKSPKMLLYNKIDKLKGNRKSIGGRKNYSSKGIEISCLTGDGLGKLKKELIRIIQSDIPDLTDRMVLTSERHKKKLEAAVKYFNRAGKGIKKSLSPELIAFELRQGINEIDEITGRIYNEEILDRIFARFCIGK